MIFVAYRSYVVLSLHYNYSAASLKISQRHVIVARDTVSHLI